MLIDGIVNCHYSAHDLSRCRGEGPDNFGRFNMPIEMGMALFHALKSQRTEHRCAFFVTAPYSHGIFAPDLAGLDPIHHGDNDRVLVGRTYEWLRDVVKSPVMNRQATTVVQDKYHEFCLQLQELKGGGGDGCPQHAEVQELMYEICGACGCLITGEADDRELVHGVPVSSPLLLPAYSGATGQ
jgi:hypothetical protein